jgi:Homeodomain-like domain
MIGWIAHCTCQFALTVVACQPKLTGMESDELSDHIRSGDPAVGLRAVGALRRLAEQVEAAQVRAARQQGWTWEQIGDALGVSRQSVHAKYRK